MGRVKDYSYIHEGLKKLYEGTPTEAMKKQGERIHKMVLKSICDPFNGWIPFKKDGSRDIYFRKRTDEEQKEHDKFWDEIEITKPTK